MEVIKYPVIVTSLFLFVYALTAAFNYPFPIIFSLFLVTHVLFVWMIIRILKDGTPSEKTFDEAFYEDVEG